MGWYEKLRGEEILGDEPGEGYRRKTGAIDTRTSRPIYGESANEEPASFWTNYKAGWMDDPDTKIGIYAKARGIPEKEVEDRYAIVDGEVVFVGEGGQLYRERPVGIGTGLKGELAEQAAHAPEMIGNVIGAISPHPILGSAAGGAIGEGIRKAGGALMFDEPVNAREIAKDVGGAGLLGGLGAGVGKWSTALAERLKSKTAGELAKRAGRDRATIAALRPQIARREALAREFGFDGLSADEAVDSPVLQSRFNTLLSSTRTGDKAGKLLEKRRQQTEAAVNNFLNEIAPHTTRTAAGQDVQKAVRGGIEALKDQRHAAASPIYDEAWAEAAPFDTAKVVEEIDRLIAASSRKQGEALKGLRKQFFREAKEGEEEALEDRLSVINEVKFYLDDLLRGKTEETLQAAPSDLKTLGRKLAGVKKMMMDPGEKASPKYPEAVDTYARLSPPVERARDSLAGETLKLKEDDAKDVAKKLFSTIDSSPEAVAYAKQLIRGQDPAAWDSALRVYLKETLEGVVGPLATGNTRNVAGNFSKKVGRPGQMDILKAAMEPAHFQKLERMLELFQRTAKLYGKESVTATRLEEQEDLKRGGMMAVAKFVKGPFKAVGGGLEDLLYGARQDKLIDAIMDPRAGAMLNRIWAMPKVGKQWANAFGAWLGAVSHGYFSNDPNDKKLSKATIQEMMRNGVGDKEIIRELGRRYYNEKQAKDLIGIAKE